MTDLAEFVDANANQTSGVALDEAGPSCLRLRQILGDAARARSVIATVFWQAFLHSPALFRAASHLHVSPGALLRSEALVVYRAWRERFDLLCFMPTATASPLSILVNPTPDEIMVGWNAAYGTAPTGPWSLATRGPLLAVEVVQKQAPFSLVVASPPLMEPTRPPSAACDVVTGANSTAGVVARDRHGRDGVTAAYHAIGSAVTATVNGVSGTVVRSDPISDSCFIEVMPPAKGVRGSKGPMRNMLPRGQQSADFEGWTSKSLVKANIIAWSVELPNPTPRSQAKVYTQQISNPGDSGSALVTDDDYVAGFAFERSAYNTIPDFSSWIWADSVFQALDLEYPP
jgi:hypothetical protein